jgi:Uri superfamily endonuclease
MDDAGTYALMIFSRERLYLQIGRLGTYEFPPGFYIYVGSALRGLNSRLKRYLNSEKLLHWHIDYLLLHARIIQTWYSLSNHRLECTWNTIVAGLYVATPIIPGFGSSDCGCQTHLTRFLTTPSINNFKRELKNRGLPQLHRLTI